MLEMSMLLIWTLAVLVGSALCLYNETSSDNLVVYWGQNGGSYKASLASTCASSGADVIVLSFLTTFFGPGNLPVVDFAAFCGGTPFADSALLKCDAIAQDIRVCQDQGVKVLLSLGGATGTVGFASATQAVTFADTLWDIFGAGSSNTRTFGDVVLDGYDLDIEGGSAAFYSDMVKQLRMRMNQDTSKSYYIAAAPQCVFPDAHLSEVMDNAALDMIFVQFYNNPCSLSGAFNYDTWLQWSKTAPNPSVKLYLGVPAAPGAAGSGFASIMQISDVFSQIRETCGGALGGIMTWDSSFMDLSTDDHFGLAVKAQVLVLAGQAVSTIAASVVPVVAPVPTISQVDDAGVSTPSMDSSTTLETTSSYAASTPSDIASSLDASGTCAVTGAMQCVNDGFATCDHGSWVVRACAPGTQCRAAGDSIICDYPGAKRKKRGHSHKRRRLGALA